MEKKDLEDFLARTVALVMVPVLGILIEQQTEGIHVDRDKAAANLTTQMKKVIMKSILDWENIRPLNVGPHNVRSQLRGMEKEIFENE